MAKRFFIVLLALSLAAAAFAAGQKENQYGALQGDKLVLKGTVSLQDYPHPVLKVGDKQYVLMVPPRLVDASGVKDGAQVTVQGYQTRRMPMYDAKYIGLFVTQATIDGKDYDLTRYYADRMMGGWGMMGGRGFGPGGFAPGGFGPGYGMMGRGYGPGPGGMMGRGFGYGPGGWDDDD